MSERLDARGVTIHYQRQRSGDNFLAVSGLDIAVEAGEFVTIVGPSGCGKTTFLNAVDGLLPLTAGTITVGGTRVTGPGHDRAMVFQQPSLLPWRTVLGNVNYGMETQGLPDRATRKARCKEFIELVGLGGFEDSFPGELSGGMQQRVNLARALATDPELLLLDEPFGALDAQTRETMQLELLRVWTKTKKTALFITHDIVEAVYLADRVIVMTARPGRVKLTERIDLPRPRDLRIKRDPAFTKYELRIWESIREEVLKSDAARAEVA